MEQKLIRSINEALFIKFHCTPETNDKSTIKPVNKYLEEVESIIHSECFSNLNEIIRSEGESQSPKKYICAIQFWLNFFFFTIRIGNSKIDKLTFWKHLSAAMQNAKNNEPIQ